jgi:hypothetical protein
MKILMFLLKSKEELGWLSGRKSSSRIQQTLPNRETRSYNQTYGDHARRR